MFTLCARTYSLTLLVDSKLEWRWNHFLKSVYTFVIKSNINLKANILLRIIHYVQNSVFKHLLVFYVLFIVEICVICTSIQVAIFLYHFIGNAVYVAVAEYSLVISSFFLFRGCLAVHHQIPVSHYWLWSIDE